MVFPGIWFIFWGQNRVPYNREPVYRVGKVKWHQVWPNMSAGKIFWHQFETQYMVGHLTRTTQVEYLNRHPFDSAVVAGIVKTTVGRWRAIATIETQDEK